MLPTGFDMNLLRVLGVLIEERSVTRTGERLGRTQSAISNALGRLRTAFADPLLVRGADGLVLTPRARELEPQLRQILGLAGACFSGDEVFDPAVATGTVRIGAPDRLSLPVAVPVLKALRRAAPGLATDWITADREHALDLIDNDRIDLAIGWFDKPPSRFTAEPVFRDALVCLTRAGHALDRGGQPADIETVLSFPHLVVSGAGDRKAGFDDMLAQLGRERHAAISVTNFMTVPDLLAGSDLVGVFTSRIAAFLARRDRLATTPLPAEIDLLDHYMVWHGRNDASPRHAWLRGRVRDVCATSSAHPGG